MKNWVVVGAGTGGCVAASRLSEDGDAHVTLLDDGPDLVEGNVPAAIDGPNFLGALALPGRTHLGLMATRQTGAAPSLYQRGRGLGGSSAVNAMLALRGGPDLYRSWGWHDVDEIWQRVAIPVESPDPGELGVVDRALLAADNRTATAQLTRRDRRRVTSAEAYLWPARGRPNLTIRPDAAVDRLLVDGRRVVGVRLVSGEEVAADHVVMAAGAIHTPAILLRSGIDTPGVGEGLDDHPSAAFTLRLRDGVAQDPTGLVTGTLLGAGGLQVLPMNHLGDEPHASGLAVLMVALMRPRSRGGRVSLSPGETAPRVEFAQLSEGRDVDALTAGVRLAAATLRHDAFAEIVDAVLIDEHGATVADLTDDASIASWLRSTSGAYVHATSTCAMGVAVDADGAVIGYDSLLVCDASVFPSVPDANTHLPTTMLAERLCARWAASDRSRSAHGKMGR